MLFNLNVLNLEGRTDRWWHRPTVRLFSWVSKAIWLAEPLLLFARPNRLTSPLVACVAIKPLPPTAHA